MKKIMVSFGLIVPFSAIGMENLSKPIIMPLPLKSSIEVADKEFMQPIYNPSTHTLYFATLGTDEVCKKNPITMRVPCLETPKEYKNQYYKEPLDVVLPGMATIGKQKWIVPLLAKTYSEQDTLFINLINDNDGASGIGRYCLVRNGKITDPTFYLFSLTNSLLVSFYLEMIHTNNVSLIREQWEFSADTLGCISAKTIKEYIEKPLGNIK